MDPTQSHLVRDTLGDFSFPEDDPEYEAIERRVLEAARLRVESFGRRHPEMGEKIQKGEKLSDKEIAMIIGASRVQKLD